MNGAPHPATPRHAAPRQRPAPADGPAANGLPAPSEQPSPGRHPAAGDRRTARRSGAWLAGAITALALLAAAAAVSWDAQYVMVAAARPDPVIAALEAGIPDAGAAVFAALGIALALHGRRALRPRVLNLACVAMSLAMNALAARPGPRDAAIWVMPAAVYALASDTLIAAIRARATSPGGDATPLAAAGTALLWLLRLTMAPASTLAALRRRVIAACPATPHPAGPPPGPEPGPAAQPAPRPAANGTPRKQDRLIALAAQRHDLTTIPLARVAPVAATIGGEIGLHPGTARRVLRAHVRALQDTAPGRPAALRRRDRRAQPGGGRPDRQPQPAPGSLRARHQPARDVRGARQPRSRQRVMNWPKAAQGQPAPDPALG